MSCMYFLAPIRRALPSWKMRKAATVRGTVARKFAMTVRTHERGPAALALTAILFIGFLLAL
jgi:hypothetical protein